MSALRFRTLLCHEGTTASELLADGVTEGPALLAALDALDGQRRRGGADDVPAKNRHGARRWQLRDRAGEPAGYLYVEPIGPAEVSDPEWLAHGGYPQVRGWWRDTPAGEPELAT